jgi:hypothetical protein
MADGGDGGSILMGPWKNHDPIEDEIYAKPRLDFEVKHSIDPVVIKIEPKANPSQEFLTRLQQRADANVQLAIRKNSDYASPDRPFANFEAAPLVGVSVARGILVRMQDKLQRISNLLDRPAMNESIQDSCDDLSMYALILGCYLEQNQ